MKKIKIFFATIFLFLMAIALVSCAGGFSIKVEYDKKAGTVVLIEEVKDNAYSENETITVSVKARRGYTVETVTINDEAKELVDGKCTFVITGNTKIKVEFADASSTIMTEEALASLQNNVKFEGVYFYDENGEDYDTVNMITTIFGTDTIHQVESDVATGTIFYDNLYLNNNGILAMVYRTIENTIETIDSEDAFNDFYNPFNNLSVDDFECLEEKVFIIKDLELAATAATAITGWNESIESFVIYFDDELKATKIEIKTAEIKIDEEISYVSTYEFDVTEHGTAEVNEQLLKPYELTEAHKELEEALAKADAASNYTIRHFDHEEGYEDIDYNVFVTEDAIYSNYPGWESGYVQKGEYVYPFTYDLENEKATLEDAVGGVTTIEDLQGYFTGFNVALFEAKGNGVFKLRDDAFASTIAQYFAEGIDEMQQYSYATDFEIIIKDGMLYQASFGYSIYGMNANVTLTYSDFDNTTMPIDFENVDQVSVLDNFIGSYKDSDGNFAVIDKSGVIINGEEFTVTSYDSEYDMLIGIYNNETFYINKLSTNQIFVSNEDYSITYTLSTIEDVLVEIPEDYKGVWENEEHSLLVQTHLTKIDGKELKLLSFDEYEGIVALDGETTYCFALEENTMIVIVIEGEIVADNYTLNKTNKPIGTEIPTEYVGVYETRDGSNIKVEITYGGIKINDIEFEIDVYTSIDGFVGTYNGMSNYSLVHSAFTTDYLYFGTEELNYVAYRVIQVKPNYIGSWESTLDDPKYTVKVTDTTISINGEEVEFMYDAEYGYTSFYNGETVYLKHIISAVDGSDCLVLYSDTFSSVLMPKAESSIPTEFYGTFVGENEGTTYTIVITETSIKINDVEAEITAYDQYEGFTLSVEGAEYYLMNKAYEGPVDAVVYLSGDYTIYVTCNRQEIPSVVIPTEFYGTFVGENEGTTYTIVITETSIKINDVEAEITAYDQYEGFTLSVEGAEYYLMNKAYEGPVDAVVYLSGDYTIYVTCDRQEIPSVVIPTEFYGTFVGENEHKYVIVINETGITVNTMEVEIISYSEEEGFVLLVNGAEYYLMSTTYEGPISTIMYMASDNSVFVSLHKEENAIPTEFYGTYVGENSGVTYTIVITVTNIVVNNVEAEIISYSKEEGFVLLVNGAEYYLMSTTYEGPIASVLYMASDNSLFVTCDKNL